MHAHGAAAANPCSSPTGSAKPRKLCSVGGHSMAKCPKYVNYATRVRRCGELKLCSFCTSSKHLAEACPGKDGKLSFQCFTCKSSSHI